MASFGFCVASSLIWGDGGFLFHFIPSKIEVQTFAILEISKARTPKTQGLLCDMPPLRKKVN